MEFLLFFLLFIALMAGLAYARSSLIVATAGCIAFLAFLSYTSSFSLVAIIALWILFGSVLVPLNIPPVRRKFITTRVFNYAKKMLPTLSSTEEQALEAGTVGWDGQIFSGNPNWKEFFSLPVGTLTQEEQDFINNQALEVCRMIDPWELNHIKFTIPQRIREYMMKEKFVSLIIPKEYGGRDFSCLAQSAIQVLVGSRSTDTAICMIGVPNSLGPAELLLKYGTKEQQDYYLPRLATGEELPCFALTGPYAGSDAGSLPDYGIVEKGTYKGKQVIGIRLNFHKRYITLAPFSTLIALAFKLYDPDHLIGDMDEYGITCALVPSNSEGIDIGRHHLPLHQVFPNGPIHGKDVFIPVDQIIGGPKMAGKGWKMLMECLSVGRATSLPSGATNVCKVATYTSTLYSKIRRGFRVPIGKFEGIQEKLAECAGYTYITDSLRLFTLNAIDRGEKPAVPSAISKYHATEFSRKAMMNAMDIHAGKGIIMGPNNYLAHSYEGNPIAITVEGANILTRNMIIFGQGGTRCHPHLLDEINAIKNKDLNSFDKHLMKHVGFLISNRARAFIRGITGGLFIQVPKQAGSLKQYYQQITRLSSAFAYVADISMITLGGKLKFKEALSARLGDILSMLYMASCVLKKYEDDGRPGYMKPIVEWSLQYLLYEAQQAFDGLIRNFPNRFIAFHLRMVVFPWGRRFRQPNDALRHEVANLLLDSEEARLKLAEGIYLADDENNLIAKLGKTARILDESFELERRVHKAKKEGKIHGHYFNETIEEAAKAGIITKEEEKQLLEAFQAMTDIINVDDFDLKDLAREVESQPKTKSPLSFKANN